MKGSAERRGAVRALLLVDQGGYANRLLAKAAQPGVRARVLGVLRWQRFLDAVLRPLSSRALERLDPEVLAVLRIALFEISRLGVPAPVATDGAVRLVRTFGKSSAAGLVNAVLRKAAVSWSELQATAPADVALSHPRWLYRRWSRAFGDEVAQQIMATDQEPAAPWVWFADEESRQAIERSGVVLTEHPWCPGAVTAVGEKSVFMAATSNEGCFIQDPSSQVVALLAAQLAPAGSQILDLCAAPGGKTALMKRHAKQASVVAADLRLARARLLRGSMVVAADGTAPPWAEESFDVVLLDAPCSGTGTLRRHPELRWRLEPGTMAERAELQIRLVESALSLVRPGGVVVYSTCSIEHEENEAVIAAAAGHETVDLETLLPAGTPAMVTDQGGIRILPHQEGDGFTVHAMRKG